MNSVNDKPIFGEVPTDRRSQIHSLPAVTAVAAGEVQLSREQAMVVLQLAGVAEAAPDGSATYEGQKFGKGYLGQLARAVRMQLHEKGIEL